MLQSFVRCITLCLLFLVSACSIYSLPGQTPEPVEGEPAYTESVPPATAPMPAPRPPEPTTSAAYGPLLAQADQASTRGDYEQALALLERAHRIDPDNVDIYLEMARTHDAKGDINQARATAERGLLYCNSPAQCNALRAYTH